MENNYKKIDLRDAGLRVAHEFIVNSNYYYNFIEGVVDCFFKGIMSNCSFDDKVKIMRINLNNFMFDFFIKGDIPDEMKEDLYNEISKDGEKFIRKEVLNIFEDIKNKIKGEKDE